MTQDRRRRDSTRRSPGSGPRRRAYDQARDSQRRPPQRRRPQQSVHNGMGQYIGIRMPQKPKCMRNLHASKDQLSSFNELVDVIAVSDSHAAFLPSSISSAILRSRGVVIFRFSSLPSVR